MRTTSSLALSSSPTPALDASGSPASRSVSFKSLGRRTGSAFRATAYRRDGSTGRATAHVALPAVHATNVQTLSWFPAAHTRVKSISCSPVRPLARSAARERSIEERKEPAEAPARREARTRAAAGHMMTRWTASPPSGPRCTRSTRVSTGWRTSRPSTPSWTLRKTSIARR